MSQPTTNSAQSPVLKKTWNSWVLGTVLVICMVANAEAVDRYASRVVLGWKLQCLILISAGLPLFMVAVPRWIQRKAYPWMGIAAAGLCLVAWHMVPVESLRVDRWELMANFLHRLFHGDYPYLASSHLNPAPPAPFPWLYLVGIPAWLIGEIGWFPLASLILLVFSVPKSSRPVLVIGLATSFPVLYEVVVRSNIVANAALVGAFLMMRPNRSTRSLVLTGVLGGIVLCTRASFAGPILVWAGAVFLGDRRWKDLLVWGSVASTVVAIPFVLLVAIWGWPVFRDWNPFNVQGSIQSPWVPLTALVLSPWVGAAAKSASEKIGSAFFIALIPMLSLLLPVVWDGTFWNTNRGYFEVAFWNTALVLGLLTVAIATDPQAIEKPD
jgi:hypothetical protein